MHHLMMNLPIFGTLGVVALLAGPLAELVIVSGAWVLERLLNAGAWILGQCLYAEAWAVGKCPLDERRVSAGPSIQPARRRAHGQTEHACAA
jgi:hypothetical protein